MKKNNILSWLLPLVFVILISLSTLAYKSGSTISNHETRIETLEKNQEALYDIEDKIDILLKR